MMRDQFETFLSRKVEGKVSISLWLKVKQMFFCQSLRIIGELVVGLSLKRAVMEQWTFLPWDIWKINVDGAAGGKKEPMG